MNVFIFNSCTENSEYLTSTKVCVWEGGGRYIIYNQASQGRTKLPFSNHIVRATYEDYTFLIYYFSMCVLYPFKMIHKVVLFGFFLQKYRRCNKNFFQYMPKL